MDCLTYFDNDPGHAFDYEHDSYNRQTAFIPRTPIDYRPAVPTYLEDVMHTEYYSHTISMRQFDSQVLTVIRNQSVRGSSRRRRRRSKEEPLLARTSGNGVTGRKRRRHSDDGINRHLLLKKLATEQRVLESKQKRESYPPLFSHQHKQKRQVMFKEDNDPANTIHTYSPPSPEQRRVMFKEGKELATNIQTGEPIPYLSRRPLQRIPAKDREPPDDVAFNNLMDSIDIEARRKDAERRGLLLDPEAEAKEEEEIDQRIEQAKETMKKYELHAVQEGFLDFRLYVSSSARYIYHACEIVSCHGLDKRGSEVRMGSYQGDEASYSKRGAYRGCDDGMNMLPGGVQPSQNLPKVPLLAYESIETSISAHGVVPSETQWKWAIDPNLVYESNDNPSLSIGGIEIEWMGEDERIKNMKGNWEIEQEIEDVIDPMMQFVSFDENDMDVEQDPTVSGVMDKDTEEKL